MQERLDLGRRAKARSLLLPTPNLPAPAPSDLPAIFQQRRNSGDDVRNVTAASVSPRKKSELGTDWGSDGVGRRSSDMGPDENEDVGLSGAAAQDLADEHYRYV